MALVESFLFVYLIQDFPGTSYKLLGFAMIVMCASELPVFLHVRWLVEQYSLTMMLSCCHLLLALRVLAYGCLPSGASWLVLFIEPLHGITFTLMWCCSVEFGRRLAPRGSEAKMQVWVAGLYYRVSSGCGALIWGMYTRRSQGHGFAASYRLAAATIFFWCIAWNFGWFVYSRTRRRVPVQLQEFLGDTLLQEVRPANAPQ
eukprot:gnl/MRDRNA2_/MRDRNA2_31253_c0_seq1.p1 gnl/MRDRNA2_/MRDRNA2_31253_c0~~gnl/MRDRNA2_/MRDRNA2_31253_c0_seq1.p1  ORF type:complete len:216 (+),score=16.97 gnl/MRDRNA2_/MRDRNA2_31253_c0_seq1:45-650(+)